MQDIAKCVTPPRKRKYLKKEIPAAVESIQPVEETYQEIVVSEFSDGAVLVERNYEGADVQYVLAGDDNYVVNNADVEEIGSNKYNVIVDDNGQQSLQSPNGVIYALKENDAGEQYLVKIDTEEIVVNDFEINEQV